MNEFDQLQEIDSNINKGYKPHKQKQAPQLFNHYNEFESELSANLQEESIEQKVVELETPQQVQKNAGKFKLTLPSAPELDVPQQRNNNVKPKRVLIEPSPSTILRQTKQTEQIKIYDLEDDMEEQIAQNIQYSTLNKPEKVGFYEQNHKEDKSEKQDNSFLEVKEESIIAKKASIIIPSPSVEPASQAKLEENIMMSRLYSKVKQKEAPLVKGAFVQKQNQSDDYSYIFQDSSKKSLDSGLQVTSVYSSRDELSTRNILLAPISPQKHKRFRLPELKPYKQVLEDQVYQMPSQLMLKDEKEEKEEEIEKPNTPPVQTRSTMSRSRQVVIKGIEITDVPNFVKKAVPYGKRLECMLTRNKSWCSRYFLDYDLVTTDGKFLISCKKMACCLTSTYNLSLERGSYNATSQFFLGRSKGNFLGSIFNLYTYNTESFNAMQMVGTICYGTDCSCCSEKCRELEIYLKDENYRFFELAGTEIEKDRNLKDLYEVESNRSLRRIIKCVNKQPRWVPDPGVFAMNFHGKSKHPSVKNAIIIQEGKPDQQLLLIAKHNDNQFSFDICYPFSPLVAFGLMITSFDFKLASQ